MMAPISDHSCDEAVHQKCPIESAIFLISALTGIAKTNDIPRRAATGMVPTSGRLRELANMIRGPAFGHGPIGRLKMKAFVFVLLAACIATPASATGVPHPVVITKEDVAGGAFKRPTAKTHERNGNKTEDYLTLMTSDKKYETGMYRSGATHFERKGAKTYGVDEFMYFIEGSVTLTSIDGTVQTISAGEAVTIPHDWQGTWDTKGYTKFYAIYAPKGDAD